MTFAEAMCALESGKKVRCSSWRSGSVITRRELNGIVSYGHDIPWRVNGNNIQDVVFAHYHPSIADMHSKDWEVVE